MRQRGREGVRDGLKVKVTIQFIYNDKLFIETAVAEYILSSLS